MNKIIIIAHEFSPELGSECCSGWNIVTRLAKSHQLIVVHANENQLGSQNYTEHLKSYKAEYEALGCEFIGVSYPNITRFLLKVGTILSNKSSVIGNQFIYFINYNLWHRKVRKYIQSNVVMEDVALIHLLNHISYREPGYLSSFSKPFIWGPISGLATVNSAYLKDYPLKHKIFGMLRNISSHLMLTINRRIIMAARATDWLFCVTKEDQNKLGHFAKNSSILLDVGSNIVPKVRRDDFDGRRIRILWVGRVDFNKGLDILFHALSALEDWNLKLDVTIVGDGPQLVYFQLIATNLELHQINWLGNVRHSDVGNLMNTNDLLVHTSIKEAGCAVVLEALSHGLPVIAHDAFGMAYEIDKTCGCKMSYITPESSSRELAQFLANFISKPSQLCNLSEGAYTRAKQLSWDGIVHEIDMVYSEVCGKE